MLAIPNDKPARVDHKRTGFAWLSAAGQYGTYGYRPSRYRVRLESVSFRCSTGSKLRRTRRQRIRRTRRSWRASRHTGRSKASLDR